MTCAQQFYIENKNVGNKADSEDWRSTRSQSLVPFALLPTD